MGNKRRYSNELHCDNGTINKVFKSEKQCIRAIFKLQQKFGGDIAHYKMTEGILGLTIEGLTIAIQQCEAPHAYMWYLDVPSSLYGLGDDIREYIKTLDVSSLPKYDPIYMI